jgi:hypothetical protein
MSIDPKYKAYVDFIDANGFILGDIISNPNEITSYFDPDCPKKNLFDYVLLSRNELSNRLFNIFFKSGNYDYETIYGNDKYIISYISFCLTYNYKENFEISELKDLKDYFTDTGPTIELLLKLLYSSELYSKFLNGNNMLLHRLKTETNHTIEKYIEFIETNGAIFFKENSYFNEDKINQWFDPKNGFKYDDLSKDVYLAKIIVENIKEKDWKSKITNPDTLYVLELLENYKILFNKLSFEHSDKIQQVFSKDYFEQLKKLGLLTNDIENKQIDQVKYYTDFILDNVSSCEMLKSINDENDLFNFKINREVFDTIINNKINSNDIKKVQKIIDKIYLMHTGITYELRKLLKEDNFSKLINLSSEDFEIKPGQPGQPGHKISNFDYFKFNDVVKYNLYKEDLKYYIDIFKNEESIQLFNNLYLCLKNNVSDTLNEGTNFIFKLAAAIGKQEELFEEIAFKLNDKSITDKDRDIIIFNALRVIYGKDTLNKIDDFSKLTTIGDIETKMEPNKLLYGGDLKYYKNLIIKYLIDFNNGNNLELKEYDKFQDNNIDIDTINLIKLKIETKLKMIYSKDFSSIDHEYANYLEDSLHRAELLLFYIESIMKAVNSIDNVDDFKKLIDEIKENEEKFLPIRMYSISLNENIRQLYELDAQLSLTKISDVIEEVNSNEKTKEKVLKHSETLDCDYYDLSTYEYTIFSHINSDLESLFNPDYFKNSQLCTSQYSDRGAEGEYGHSSGFTYGFDSIPIGGFIVSSTSNSSSNDYFHNNIDYSSFIQQDSIMQREIKESSSLVASSKWGEVDTIRGNMYPTCIIISGDEPTYEEVKEAQELARLLSKYGIIKYESGMAPLVKLQKRGTKKLEQDLNVFDFSIYKYMTETLYTTDGSLSNIKWTDKEKEIIHYISKIAKTLYASNKNSTIDKPFTNSSDSEKKDNPNNNAISETVKFESETYINSNNFERKKTRLEKLKEALETYKSLLNEQELDKMKFIRNVTKRTKTSHTLYKGKMNEKEYYIKPALDGSLDAPWRAGAMSVGFNMQKLINPTTKIDVIIKALDYLGTGNKIMCSLIEEKKNTKDLSIFDGDLENYLPNLSETQLIDILKEHIVDHLLFNYDTKGANFIYDKKHVYGIDKEQALKSCLDNIRGGEGIDPSRKSGDGNAFYQIIFENYKDILSPDTIKKVYEDIIEKVESKSLKEFLDLYEPYLKVIERKDLNRYIERIMGRRLRLVQEIKDFVFDKFNVELEYSEKDLSSELAELNVYLKNAGLNEINVNVSKTK